MGLSSIATRTPSPVLPEMPRTPKKRPRGGVHHAQHQPPKSETVGSVVSTTTVDSKTSDASGNSAKLQKEPAAAACAATEAAASNSPHRQQQQPYVQHNIDRYFSPQPPASAAAGQTLPVQQQSSPTQGQGQSFQSDSLAAAAAAAPPAVVDVKGSNTANECSGNSGSSNNNNNNNNNNSNNNSISISKPQKENVPDATALSSVKKGQQRSGASDRQISTGRKGTGGRPPSKTGSTTAPSRRKQTSGQKSSSSPSSSQQQLKLTASDGKGGVAGGGNGGVKNASNNDRSRDEEKDIKRITDYFQLRRSHRRTKGEVIKYKKMLMEEKVLHADESGFQIVKFEDKGRGVVSNVDLSVGDYVLEYAGDLIDLKEARRREESYVRDTSVGCYMYYFQHENASHCIDATPESDRLGRLINHSIRSANLKTKSVTIGGVPRLVFVAKRNIGAGEELLYDYGDRSKASLQSHPWLKS